MATGDVSVLISYPTASTTVMNVVAGALQGTVLGEQMVGTLGPVLTGSLEDEPDYGGLTSGPLSGTTNESSSSGTLS